MSQNVTFERKAKCLTGVTLIGDTHKHSERLLSSSRPDWDSRVLILRDRAGQRGNNRLNECHHETITHVHSIMQMEEDLSSVTAGGVGQRGKESKRGSLSVKWKREWNGREIT